MTINTISMGGSSSVGALAGDFTETQPVDVMVLPVPPDRSQKHMTPETSEEKRKKFQVKSLHTETAELPGVQSTPESVQAPQASLQAVPAQEPSHFLRINCPMYPYVELCLFVSKKYLNRCVENLLHTRRHPQRWLRELTLTLRTEKF